MNKEKSKLEISIRETDAELVFNFDPSVYAISTDVVNSTFSTIITTGGALGLSADNIEAGEISIYFDPNFHTAASREIASEQMLFAILNSSTIVL